MGVLDLFLTGPPSAKTVDRLMIDLDRFVIGNWGWPLPGRDKLQLGLDSQQRLIISSDGRSFTFGPVKTRWNNPGNPQYLFVPEAGDVVSFTRDASRLNWYTPFAFSFMGKLPKQHRYAYGRLRWIKNTGATLDITWRDQESFYAGPTGWADGSNPQMLRLRIR